MAQGSKKIVLAALSANALIAVGKFLGTWLTGSAAMLSEAIHSVVDTSNQGLLLHGLKASQKPADEKHPYGYGKELYFWSFVVAILIFSLGGGLAIYEGIHHLLHPSPPRTSWVNYAVLSFAFVFESVAWTMAWKEFKARRKKRNTLVALQESKDPALFVILFEDSAALIGLVIAALGITLSTWTGQSVYDGIASILIGLILALSALWMAMETKGLLVGESATQEMRQAIGKLLAPIPEINHVKEVLTLHMGPEYVLVNLNVDFHNHLNAEEVEKCIAQIDQILKGAYPKIKRVFVEAEARNILQIT